MGNQEKPSNEPERTFQRLPDNFIDANEDMLKLIAELRVGRLTDEGRPDETPEGRVIELRPKVADNHEEQPPN